MVIRHIKKYNMIHPRYDFNSDTQKKVFNLSNAVSFNDIMQPIINTHCKIIQLKNFQGMIYDVGDSDDAGVHSEPKKNQNRIILAILLSEITAI